MDKGKKVYTLKVWYNDETGECTGLVECIDEVQEEGVYKDDERNLALEFISDCIPDEYADLINCFEIGVA